jgi:hypothetical protein
VAADAKPPVKLGPTNAALWKVPLSFSPSSPCIWGDLLFVTAFEHNELQTRCYQRADGKLAWSRGVKVERLETFHRTESSPAASAPATDGERVVTYFGSFGLICHAFLFLGDKQTVGLPGGIGGHPGVGRAGGASERLCGAEGAIGAALAREIEPAQPELSLGAIDDESPSDRPSGPSAAWPRGMEDASSDDAAANQRTPRVPARAGEHHAYPECHNLGPRHLAPGPSV